METGLRRYLIEFQEWTKKHCAPVFFRNELDERINGSMTFVDTGQEVLGITAGHVADRILDCCDGKPGHGCQVGSAELDPRRLIARHPSLDLATFHLSQPFLAAAAHYAISASTWPPSPPTVGEKALIGGYPGIFRVEKESERQIDIGFAHFGVSVSSVSETQFLMVLNIETATSLAGEWMPPKADLGGVSGGCVFRVIENGLISRLELMGILVGGSPEFEITLAHPLSSVKMDGTFFD